MEKFEKCEICPRKCKVNRSVTPGFCHELFDIKIAKIIENFQWEEPCFNSEGKGVLAIFFSGCNLGCDYCQNHEISRGGVGKTYFVDQFVSLIESAQERNAAIDLITPTHFSAALVEAFKKINKKVPVIWNTSGYETVENVRHISEFVDIFLTDFKYADDTLGQEFSACTNYFSAALPAIKEMCLLKEDKFLGDFMLQGVVIRHLVLPGYVQNSLKVLDEIKENFPERKISIMSQFLPNGKGKLKRKITPIEYKAVLTHAEKLGLENGYIQDFESSDRCFVPNFD